VKAALIAGLAAAGGLARYGVGVAVGTRSFPWATLAINLAGSLVLGFVIKAGLDRGWPDRVVTAIAIGFLGAFTTFSTFSYETFTLLRTDRATTAAIYVAASLVGGIAAAAAGYMLAATTT
jgi:fluoride exporter